jgi:uncharacterized protein (DUF427 family)
MTIVSREAAMTERDPQITLAPHPGRVVVTFGGCTVADSRRALVMRAPGTAPVAYIPRADVDMTLLRRTTHTTHCPYKGDAHYFSIETGERSSPNAVWTYESPTVALAAIKELVAFYPERVDAIEERAD